MLVKLKDIATFINGRAYLMPELQNTGKYRIVRVGNFSGKDEWFYSDMELDPEKYCEKGDLLYKWACNFGPEIWKEEKVIYHYHIWKVIPDESKVNKFYLYYKLAVMTPYWLASTNGSTMVHITKEIMEDKIIELPNIDTQNKIAEILTRLDAQIERNEAMVKRLQVLGQAIYTKFFSNENNFIPLLSFPYIKILKPGIKEFEGCKRYIATAEVEGEKLNYKAPIIEYDTRENRANMQPIINSVWFAKMKNSIKHIYISKVDDFLIDNFIFSTGFFGIKCDEVAFEYLLNYVNLPYFEKTKDIISHGATMEGINNEDLKSFKIQFPPKNQLESFHNKVKSIYYEISKINQSTYKLTLLKGKILPLLINGQIS